MNFSPLQKPAQAVALGAARGRGEWAGPAVLVAVAWLVTYTKAVVRGDDVNHLCVPYGNAIFLPNLAPGWIPNRVLDLYGRNLLGRVFDLVFFPVHELLGVSFFQAYKLFNATLFAAFLWAVHRYVVGRLGPRPGAPAGVFVALAVLLIMPWTNEVRALCYELPAFLLFVLLTQVLGLLRGAAPGGMPAGWLLVLSFVVAFSLEGYAAILLGTVVAAAALARPWRVRNFWRGEAALVSGLTGAFCVAALVTTAAFSARAGVSENFIPVKQYIAHLRRGAYLPVDPASYATMLGIGLAGLCAMAVFRRRFVALSGFGGKDEAPGWASGFCDFALVGCVTLVVAALISMEANQSFFFFRVYPWGGLLITAMLFGLTAVAAPLAAWANRPVVVFLLALIISRMAVAALGQAAAAYDESVKTQAAYAAVVAGATGVVNTGLDLGSMEMPLRSLPTADSPDWFIDGYRLLFLKYYGVNVTAVFR
jgi:hypothetical protein